MKYITFATLAALNFFISAYDQRIEDQLHIHFQPGCHYTQPIELIATAPFFAAPIPDNHPVPLLASEEALLVDEAVISSWTPQL